MRPASRHTATPAAEGMPDRRYRLPRREGGFQPNELLDVATRITALGGVEIAGVTHFPVSRRRPRTVKTSPRRTLKRWSTRRKRCARRAFLSNRLTPRRPIAATPSLRLPAVARRILNPATRLPAPFLPTNVASSRNASPCFICRKCLITQDRTACASAAAIIVAAACGMRWFSQGMPFTRRGRCRSNRTISITTGLEGNFAVGSPVIMCFRTQIFVTRSDVALIRASARASQQ